MKIELRVKVWRSSRWLQPRTEFKFQMEITNWNWVPVVLLISGIKADNFTSNQSNPSLTMPIMATEYYSECDLVQVKIHLVKPVLDLAFLSKLDDLVQSVSNSSNGNIHALMANIELAVLMLKSYDSRLLTPISIPLKGEDIPTIFELNIDMFTSQFMLAQVMPLDAILQELSPPDDTDEFLFNLSLLESQVTQSFNAFKEQERIYNNIISGDYPVDFLFEKFKEKYDKDYSHNLKTGIEQVATLLDNKEVHIFVNFILASQKKYATKFLILPLRNYRPKYNTFLYIDGYGVEASKKLPSCLLTAKIIYSKDQVDALLDGDSRQPILKTIYTLSGQYESFYYSLPGQILFYNNLTKIDYDFGDMEQYSPILLKFHEKIIKIGTNIVHFFVNNVNIPEKFTKFDIPALISSSIDNIFSFQNVIDNLSTGEIIVISSFSIGSLIISLIASFYTYRRRRLYLLKQARKQRERANLRSVNLLLRNRKPDSP